MGRRPRGLIKVGGAVISGWKSWKWDGNSLYRADTFSAEFAINGLPQAYGLNWWAAQTSLEVELFAGFPADPVSYGEGDVESLFIGVVDELSISWDGQTLQVNGRDLTARFLDNKTSEKWPNNTASQIATLLANRRGLTPVVTATKTQVGKYYKDTHTRLADDRTEWDLLTWLAREEGFVVYVHGRELHFGPAPTAGTYRLTWQPGSNAQTPSGNLVRLSTTRVLTVAKDISVTVRSWHGKKKQAYVRTAQRNRKGSGQVQNYTYTIANLDPAQAQARANEILAQLSRHEMRLTMRGPADNTLGKADLITLSGTGTPFDQTYYPDSITRALDVSGGYAWDVRAKNHSPESEPSL